MTPTAPKLPEQPALDGLRGLAVAGVLAFHSDGALVGGYLGVDLFFLLSGYLITALLLAEVEARGRIDLARFWERRARRLLPAALALLVVVAVASPLWVDEGRASGLRGDALATLVSAANLRALLSDRDYWELFASPSPLEHAWSLSIEQQFYALFPPLLLLVARPPAVARRRVVAVAVLGALASSVAMALLFDEDEPSRAYLGTDARAAPLLLGAALAAWAPPGHARLARSPRLGATLAGLGLVATAVAWATLDGRLPLLYRGGLFATELAGLAVLAQVASAEPGWIGRALSLRPLRTLGRISYGLYLWHWPVFTALPVEGAGLPAPWVHALRLGLSLALAFASERYVERPLRDPSRRIGSPLRLALGGGVATAAIIVVAVRGRPAAPPPVPAVTAAVAPSHPSAAPAVGPYDVSPRELPPRAALPAGTPRILVLGDSVAAKLGMAMRHRQAERHAFVAERGVGDCTILEGEGAAGFTRGASHSCAAGWLADVRDLLPDRTLVVLGGGYYGRLGAGRSRRAPCDPVFDATYEARLLELLRAIAPAAGRLSVARVPYPVGRWRSPGLLERVDCFNRAVERAAVAAGAAVVRLDLHVCPTPDCVLEQDGARVRPDGLHFDGVGAEGVARWTLGELLGQPAGRAGAGAEDAPPAAVTP